MLDGINWETVLVASIIPIFGLIGIIYQGIQKRREAREGNDATKAARREPTWKEVVDENRQLREDLNEQGEKHNRAIEELKESQRNELADLNRRFDDFERKTNTRIGALSNMLHSASTQWPADHPGPFFDREYLDALENTDVPFVWRNRIRPVS